MRSSIVAVALCAAFVFAPCARADDSGPGGKTIRDPTLFGAGIALATSGIASTLGGLALVAIVAPINQISFFGEHTDVSGYYEVGVPLLVAGAIMTMAGVGMACDGGRRVPRIAFAPVVSPRGASVGFVATF